MRHLPTPSSYPRLAKCLGSAVIPNDPEVLPGMSRGTAIHGFLERCALGMSPEEALAGVPLEWRADCEGIPLDLLPDLTAGTPELAMAWRPSTGECRILGQGLSREGARAQAAEDEVPMVADWAALSGDGAGVLLDHKTGWHEELAPAAEHMQLLTYGAVYLRATGLDEVSLYLCRPDRETPGWDGPVVMDAARAEAHLLDVRTRIFEASAAAREAWEERRVFPALSVGPWCAWCPAQRRCPAQVSALLAVLNGDAESAVADVVELTDVQAGSLWAQLKAAEKLALALRKRLEGFARVAPLPLPNGDVLAVRAERQEEPKPLDVFAYLKTRYGEDVAYAAVKPDTTWGLVEAALAEKVLPGLKQAHKEQGLKGRAPSKKGLLRDVREGLRAAGAVEVKTSERVEAVNPKHLLPEAATPEATEERDV